MMLLEFEKKILEETTPHSNLLILGKGMGKETIMYYQIKFYLQIKSLVVILNFNEDEINYFKEAIDSKYICFGVSNNMEKRKERYRRGGIFVISETIFITDLLNNFIDVSLISAYFISNVENIKKDSMIEFIIDYTKKYNNDCIIRGFTDNPLLLNIETVIDILQVEKVFFYPRFSQVVKDSLEQDTNFLEKRLKMCKEIEEIQILILEIIKSILNDLKREDIFNMELKEIIDDFDLSKVSKLNRITKEMNERLGYKNNIRRLVSDIRNFIYMIGLLFSIDFECFFSLLETLWKEQIIFREKSTWINFESGMMLMEKCSSYNKINIKGEIDSQEIGENNYKNTKYRNKKIKKEADDYLGEHESEDEEKYMHVLKYEGNTSHNKIEVVKKLLSELKSKTLLLVQNHVIKEIIIKIMNKNGIHIDDIEKIKGKMFQFLKDKNQEIKINVMTHSEFKFCEEVYENVIFIDPDLGSIRKIEVLQNKAKLFKEFRVKIKNIYFVIYKDSIEEQRYLNEIRNEKLNFRNLIEKYANIPLSQKDSKIYLDKDEDSSRDFVILVDFREMRAKLPYYLYRADNNINILGLETGDYILGKTTCVERKSIIDLISSLNTGRLYLQAKMMSYKFSNCYLLIEFNRRPCLSDYFENTEKFNLMSKFILFMLNFPNIRIIWSNGALLSTKIFRCLQKREESPDKIVETIDPVLLEVVLSIPGIDCFNYKRVMNSYKNIKEISVSNIEKLNNIVGKDRAKLVFDFFNKKL